MLPIKHLITEEEVEKLASRSHLRLGRQMSEDWNISYTKTNVFNIHADLKHKNTLEQVEISSTSKGLRWKCTCSNRKNYFCEHVVAVALKALPKRVEERG